MADLHDSTDTDTAGPQSPGPGRFTQAGRDGVPALLVRVLFLGIVIGTAIALTPALVGEESWFFLAAIWVITAILVATYATGRALPAKYLVPGTLMLVLFVVYPILLTAQTSFTNYGDGTRNDKQATVDQIVGSSVTRSGDSPQYNLTIATDGDPSLGSLHLLPRPPGRPRDRLRRHRRGPRVGPRRRHARQRAGQRGRRLHPARHQADQRGR